MRSFGVRIALDGFGTGHASLSHLPTMELDMIKINSSLLNQAQHIAAQQEILSAIIKVAQSIKLQVIADGIESAAQLHHIKQLGVTLFQGLFLGPPVSANQLGLKS